MQPAVQKLGCGVLSAAGRSGSGLVSSEPSLEIRKHKFELVRIIAVANHAINRRFVTLHPLTYQL